jgi:hypothetical protein
MRRVTGSSFSTSSMVGKVIYGRKAGANCEIVQGPRLADDVIYGARGHLWRETSSMRAGAVRPPDPPRRSGGGSAERAQRAEDGGGGRAHRARCARHLRLRGRDEARHQLIFFDVIYGEKGHLWENGLRRLQNRGGPRLACDVIYGAKGHLWRETSSMRARCLLTRATYSSPREIGISFALPRLQASAVRATTPPERKVAPWATS